MLDRAMGVFFANLVFGCQIRYSFFFGMRMPMQGQYQAVGYQHPAENCQQKKRNKFGVGRHAEYLYQTNVVNGFNVNKLVAGAKLVKIFEKMVFSLFFCQPVIINPV
jgi:hypothetical protein